MALLIGCGGESLIQPREAPPLLSGDFGDSPDSLLLPGANPFTRIGCLPLGDSVMIGAIGVPVSPDRLARYDCRGIAHDSVIRAVATQMTAAAAARGRVAMLALGSWVLIDYWQDCSGTGGTGSATYENGIWELPELGTTCTSWYVYQWVPEEGGSSEPPDTPPEVPPTGGGGSSGGGEDPPPPPPPNEVGLPPLFESDSVFIPADTINCTLTQANIDAQLYCAASRLSSTKAAYSIRLTQAMERLRARGGVCESFATVLDSVGQRDAFRVSPTYQHSAWSSKGLGGMGGILIREDYFSKYYDQGHRGRIVDANQNLSQDVTLQLILAHEAEHLADPTANHVDALRTLMPHTIQCSDLEPE